MSSTVEQLTPNPQVISQPFLLQVQGYGFEDGCVVTLDGVDQVTTFESDTLLTVDVAADQFYVNTVVVVAVRSPDNSMSNDFGLNMVNSSGNQNWPTINDLAEFAKVDPDDVVLAWCLNAAVTYGQGVLGSFTAVDGTVTPWPTNLAIFQATLDYAGSLYTQRIGQADYYANPIEGSTPQQRYRRILLASRAVAIA